MMSEARSLIAELDAALCKASSSKHLAILRSVTDLLVNGANAFSSDQVAIFDDVIGRLIDKTERPALIELSARLAPLGNAPTNVIDRLARDNDIAISGPILQMSDAVTDQALVEIATTKSLKHLSMISGRALISQPVTDALVDRCDADSARKVADNKDASLSEIGFVKLINRAKSDKALAAAIGARADLPPELQPFLKLTLA